MAVEQDLEAQPERQGDKAQVAWIAEIDLLFDPFILEVAFIGIRCHETSWMELVGSAFGPSCFYAVCDK